VRAATTTEKKTKIDKCGQIEKKNKKSKSILAQSQKAKSKKSAKPKKRRFPNEKAGKLPTRRVAASSCSFKLFMLQLQWCAKGVVEREREGKASYQRPLSYQNPHICCENSNQPKLTVKL